MYAAFQGYNVADGFDDTETGYGTFGADDSLHTGDIAYMLVITLAHPKQRP